MSWFLNWLDRRGRCRIIPDPSEDIGNPVIIRYFLFLKDKKRNLDVTEKERNTPFNVFLHKICQDDPRDLHDHPWWYITIILKGGYWEHTYIIGPTYGGQQRKWYGPGSIRFSKGGYHRLQISKNCNDDVIPCWTLFIRGRKTREWGFNRNGAWVPNREYIREEIKKSVTG